MPSSQFSWQEGADQGAFNWPYFYPWGSWDGFSGYGYYPNLYLPCPEAIPSSSSSITKAVSQENGSLPLFAGIRTTPNIQVTGSVSHTSPAVNSFRILFKVVRPKYLFPLCLLLVRLLNIIIL